MSELISFEEIQKLFHTLGIRTFDAALPEGRITWLDEHRAPVAHGRCAAVLSWAASNQSLCWAEALPHFKSAGVPTVARPEGMPEYQEGVPGRFAENLAARAAQDTAAEFLYEAKTGGGGVLYLAISGFTPGAPEGDLGAPATRVAATRAWASIKLRQVGNHVASGASDSPALLRTFAAEAIQQAQYTVQGTPLAEELLQLAAQAEGWAAALPEDSAAVAEGLGLASRQLSAPEA